MVHLGDKQLTWVWCNVPMNTALLALETSIDAFQWFVRVYEYLQNVLVYGRTRYIWIVVIISEYWDWNWTTCMKTNEKILICLQAVKIHSDVTPSYALMRSNMRGLWWICNESKPLPAYTKMVVSLWFFLRIFPKFSQWRFSWGLYWMVHNYDDFCPSIFPMGFLGLYFRVQSNTVSWALVSRIGLRGVFDGTVDGLVVLVTKAMLNGWLRRSDDVR
jgi:hypothetical protein